MATRIENENVKGATQFHRPSYEIIAFFAWFIGAFVYLVMGRYLDGELAKVSYLSVPMLLMAFYRLRQVIKHTMFKVRLTSPLHPWTTLELLLKKQSDTEMTFLGKGFVWMPYHARIMREISNLSRLESISPPKLLKDLLILFRVIGDDEAGLSQSAKDATKDSSHHYIHGCGGAETDIFVSVRARRSHTLVLGTNGAGKTRLLETLVAQDIARGCLTPHKAKLAAHRQKVWDLNRSNTEQTPSSAATKKAIPDDDNPDLDVPRSVRLRSKMKSDMGEVEPNNIPKPTCGPVFILDPKGDRDLRDRAYATACKYGRGDDFYFFSPTESNVSFRVNPLANYSRQTELSNRVTALLPTGGDSDVFRQFAWRAVNVVIDGMAMAGVRINLLNLRAHIEGGIESLLSACIEKHLDAHIKHYDKWRIDTLKAESSTKKNNRSTSLNQEIAVRAAARAGYYVTNVKPNHPDTVIDGMVDVLMHDAAHYSKLISNLIPILVQLTSGPMGLLLSEQENEVDPREITSFQELISSNAIVYVSFESLADSVVGSSLGSLFLADLTACAAARHLAGISDPPVSIFVDESAEMMNDPFIQALNKGRSAGFELTLASQTISDFVARMGNEAKAMQVLGNVNTFLSMRILDEDSLQLVTEKFGETTYEEQSSNKSTTTIAAMAGRGRDFSGSVMKNAQSSSIPLVDPDLLRSLPAGHFFGHLPGGTKVKGRVLMMPLDDSERYIPELHGVSDTPPPLDARPTPYRETHSHLPTRSIDLDPEPFMPRERDASLLPLPGMVDTLVSSDDDVVRKRFAQTKQATTSS